MENFQAKVSRCLDPDPVCPKRLDPDSVINSGSETLLEIPSPQPT